MNDNAKKWVDALRSGEYGQGFNRLNDGNGGYCCLGVACELFAKENEGFRFNEEIGGYEDTTYPTVEEFYLPQRVAVWLGVKHHDGRLSTKDVYNISENVKGFDDAHTTLADFNDSNDYDFDAIADIIESEPEGLFVE